MQLISDDGYIIAKLKPVKEDYQRHFQKFAQKELVFKEILMTYVYKEFKRIYKLSDLQKYFKNALLFHEEDNIYLNRSLSCFWEEDYLVSSHLFLPLIESAFRKLIEICGGIILKPNEIGGFDRLSLSELLKKEEELINSVFQGSENISFYFRLVLTEKIGMNLRNDFAHGFSKKKFSKESTSNRIFHVLVLLSLISKTIKI